VAYLLQRLLLLRQRYEFDVALGEKRVRRAIDPWREHSHLEQRPLRSAEHESHADHQ